MKNLNRAIQRAIMPAIERLEKRGKEITRSSLTLEIYKVLTLRRGRVFKPHEEQKVLELIHKTVENLPSYHLQK